MFFGLRTTLIVLTYMSLTKKFVIIVKSSIELLEEEEKNENNKQLSKDATL